MYRFTLAPPVPGVQTGLNDNVVEQHVLKGPLLANEQTQPAVRVAYHQVLEDAVADGVHAVAAAHSVQYGDGPFAPVAVCDFHWIAVLV